MVLDTAKQLETLLTQSDELSNTSGLMKAALPRVRPVHTAVFCVKDYCSDLGWLFVRNRMSLASIQPFCMGSMPTKYLGCAILATLLAH